MSTKGKYLASRRFDEVKKFWKSRLKDPNTTADEKLEAARNLQAIAMQQAKEIAQKQNAAEQAKQTASVTVPKTTEEAMALVAQLSAQAEGRV